MSFEQATVVAFVGASLVFYLIGDSFRKEEVFSKNEKGEKEIESSLASSLVNNVFFRGIFFFFSIGFLGLAISSSQQFFKESGVANLELNNTITAGIVYIARSQQLLYIVFFVLFLVIMIERYLFKIGKDIKDAGRFFR